MFNELIHLLQKPPLWQRSSEPFWDDDHISKGMLDAHLNPDWDAASRKHEYIERSTAWLSSIIPAKGKILDIGCGPGLYAKRLSGMGYDMTGMDFSSRSIEYARTNDASSTYIYQDYLTMDYTAAFDAVLLIYCDYAAMTPDEHQILIPKVYQALKPGGVFILDVFTEKHFADKKDGTSWAVHEQGGFWSSEPHICLNATHMYENNTVSVDQYAVIWRDGIKQYLIWDMAYSARKLIDEMAPCGFNMSGIFDDVCGTPFTNSSETLCVVLKKG